MTMPSARGKSAPAGGQVPKGADDLVRTVATINEGITGKTETHARLGFGGQVF
jgi:hypothetical protein